MRHRGRGATRWRPQPPCSTVSAPPGGRSFTYLGVPVPFTREPPRVSVSASLRLGEAGWKSPSAPQGMDCGRRRPAHCALPQPVAPGSSFALPGRTSGDLCSKHTPRREETSPDLSSTCSAPGLEPGCAVSPAAQPPSSACAYPGVPWLRWRAAGLGGGPPTHPETGETRPPAWLHAHPL